ncbi:MAG: hypothetical protein EOP04_18135 [Proteobacteria bacterium]|nr:MAG: hypothetical protein EOP04_18135 [Pseudomonadota bacterium]
MTRQTDVDVLIVGAGPVGLTLACLLARYGVKFRLIDKNKALTQSSEVLKFKARSLELFEQLHLTDEILAAGRPATEQLLKTYNEERAPITKKTPPNFANSLMGLASLFRPVQKRIFSSISEIGISYEGSSLSLGKHAGRRIEMREADGYFHAYMIADPETQKEAALILRRFLGKNVKVHTLSSYPNIQNFLAKYGLHKDGILLIRPDQYIAYVGEGLKTSELSQYLGRHFKLKINDHGKAWNAAFDDEQLSL